MLAASTLRAGLHKQNSGTIDSHLLMMSGVSSYFHSEAEMNPNKHAACATPASKTKRAVKLIPNILQSYQRRSINSYGYYYLNTVYYRSSSFLLSSPSVCSPPEHVLNTSVIYVNLLSRSCRQQLLTQHPKFKVYETFPSFESPPSRAIY